MISGNMYVRIHTVACVYSVEIRMNLHQIVLATLKFALHSVSFYLSLKCVRLKYFVKVELQNDQKETGMPFLNGINTGFFKPELPKWAKI